MVVSDNSIITIDTNCFIYYFEDHDVYADKLQDVFTNIQNGKYKACMSMLSLLELLVKPKKENNVFLENRYKLLLTNYPNLSIVDINLGVIDIASSLRAKYKIKTPDSIIVATTIYSNSKYLITNDIRLGNICNEESICFISLDDIE
ncbi:PIN domain-containing protein [Herbivorax sp. ANBcel31]|uniref:type II toxin-antitoxin system VapC family toxin n=1 Tax=Herbivorax sp. ANBcel31 TaxID=3069754 RepID=UPI0027AF08E4|nr:PIN domain-containing protein [Herbivorax sp. ANBcel31]MDQ2085732.1 PIN domain-containing protein [Herbivorax sp. ANBcel31]